MDTKDIESLPDCTQLHEPGGPGVAGKQGRRGFGAIRKLPSGRYQASYVGPDTIRRKAPSTYQTREDAEAWLAARRAEIVGDEWQPPRPHRSTTLGSFAERWLAERRKGDGSALSVSTRNHYRKLLDRFILPELGAMSLRAITPETVDEWYGRLDTGPTYRAHAYSLLHAIFATAVARHRITAVMHNPCLIRGAMKAKAAKRVEPATLDELAAITEAMPGRLRLLVALSAWCALRFGEVTELRRKDMNVAAGTVRIRRGVVTIAGERIVEGPKTEAGIRLVHIPPHVVPMLTAHLRDHALPGREGLLFYGHIGEQLPHSSLMWHWNRAKAKAGRPDLTPHALRHTGATLAAQSGATIAELMARLGHTTPAMAMRYQHAAAERDAEIARRLSQLADGATNPRPRDHE